MTAVSVVCEANSLTQKKTNPSPYQHADWTIKLWDDSHVAGPVMSWDVGMPVGA